MFRFPFTNFHELNLDWILSVVKEAKTVFETGRADIDYAMETANEAKEIATQAAEGTLPDNSVSTLKLQNGAVTEEKIDAAYKNKIKKQAAQYTTMNALKQSRFVCVGDSYAAGWTQESGTVEANGWPMQIKSILGIPVADFISVWKGGAGFARTNEGENFTTLISGASVANPETVDYVIFCGGYNDNTETESAIVTGINNAVTAAKNRFPNAKIFVGFVGMNFATNSIFLKLIKTRNIYASHESLGYTYLYNIEACLYLESLMSAADKYHPNANGNRKIAEGVIRCLNSGYNHILEEGELSISGASGATLSRSSCRYKIVDDIITIGFGAFNWTKNSESESSNWHSLNRYIIPILTGGIMAFLESNYLATKTISIIARRYSAQETSGAYRLIVGMLTQFDTNKVGLLVSDTTTTGGGYLTAGFTYLDFPSFSVSYKVFDSVLF